MPRSQARNQQHDPARSLAVAAATVGPCRVRHRGAASRRCDRWRGSRDDRGARPRRRPASTARDCGTAPGSWGADTTARRGTSHAASAIIAPMRLLALVGLVAALPCQANPDRVLVLVQQQVQPATVIYEVDRLTGLSVPLPGFPSDVLPPLAIAIDPATREPIVALQVANSS